MMQDDNSKRVDSEPVAARLPAEPGWRVVRMEVVEEEVDGALKSRISLWVEPIKAWALGAPSWNIQEPSPNARLGASLWPLDEKGVRMGAYTVLHIVPPTNQDSEEQLLCDVAAYIKSLQT